MDIDLALIPSAGADSMSATLAASPGLSLSTESLPSIDAVKPGEVTRATFSARADKDGVYYATVTVTLYTAGTSAVRTFAVPLIFGITQAPASPSAAPSTAPVKKS